MTKLREECGVFGIFDAEEASVLTTLGLHSLQHRGQEGAGIVSYDGKKFYNIRKQGLVGDNFNDNEVLSNLPGRNAIGHVRYSTTGESKAENLQPLFANLSLGGFACAHNGNLTNTDSLKKELVSKGAIFQTTSDTELILQLVARSRQKKLINKLIDALNKIKGAYSLVILTNKKLIGVKDPLGIRPLVLGSLNGSYVLASETCALDIIGAKFIRDIENGEIISIEQNHIQSFKPFKKYNERPCIFERIYFASPDSIINGKTVYTYRKKLGEQLAIENKRIMAVLLDSEMKELNDLGLDIKVIENELKTTYINEELFHVDGELKGTIVFPPEETFSEIELSISLNFGFFSCCLIITSKLLSKGSPACTRVDICLVKTDMSSLEGPPPSSMESNPFFFFAFAFEP